MAVVMCVLHVQKCFSRMLTNMRQLSAKVNIENVRFFLKSILEADEFNTCKGFEDVLRLLRKSYIDAFNTLYLEQLADYLEIDDINQLISAYKSERDAFFKDPIVNEFQDAVFNKVELSGEDEVMVPEVIVPRSLVNKRTQRDMETLATQFCGSYREPVVQMDDVPESKNVTSNWPVCVAVLLGIATVLLVILAIGLKLNSSFEINNLNLQVVELRVQLTHCQNEKHQMKECEEEVKNLTEVKGRFLAMKEESNNSLAVVKHTDDLLDLLSNHNEEKKNKLLECENKLLECENSHRKLEAKVHELLLNITQIIIEKDRLSFAFKACVDKSTEVEDREHNQYSACSKELTKCETEHGKLLLNNKQMIRERDQYSFNYSACSYQLKSYAQLKDELWKNVSMLENENDKLAKSCTQCSERLTTCEESCQLFTLLYSRKCFKVMLGHVELICQPIFVM